MLPPIPDHPHPQAIVPPPQEIRGKRIVLRPYELQDAAVQLEAIGESTSEVGRWLPWCHPQYSLTDSRNWAQSRAAAWRAGHEFSFVIADVDSGEFLGGCGLNQFEWPSLRANLGYWVRTSRTGQGIATAATLLLARFGFERVALERIEIVAAQDNLGSQRVAEKAGATRECLARKRVRIRERQHDAYIFSLVRQDVVA